MNFGKFILYIYLKIHRWSCDVFRILDTDRYTFEDSSYRENAVLARIQKMGLYLRRTVFIR